MSRQYCRYCETEFVSGRACRDEKARAKCSEWAILQETIKAQKANTNRNGEVAA